MYQATPPTCHARRYVVAVTENARGYLLALAERYRAAGLPERASWLFESGKLTEVHRELENAGLIERVFGTAHGFAWRLTEAGMAAIAALS